MTLYLQADFKGLCGRFLGIALTDTARDRFGQEVTLREGMAITAFQEMKDEQGKFFYVVASGLIERSLPHTCPDARWCLRLDSGGVRRSPGLP